MDEANYSTILQKAITEQTCYNLHIGEAAPCPAEEIHGETKDQHSEEEIQLPLQPGEPVQPPVQGIHITQKTVQAS
jgi:hypothetical protein